MPNEDMMLFILIYADYIQVFGRRSSSSYLALYSKYCNGHVSFILLNRKTQVIYEEETSKEYL